jgi:hypothetical protein
MIYRVSVHKAGYFVDRPYILSPKSREKVVFKKAAPKTEGLEQPYFPKVSGLGKKGEIPGVRYISTGVSVFHPGTRLEGEGSNGKFPPWRPS